MNIEIESRTSQEAVTRVEEKTYKVESSGATITSGYSTSLLYEYCAKLPRDEYASLQVLIPLSTLISSVLVLIFFLQVFRPQAKFLLF